MATQTVVLVDDHDGRIVYDGTWLRSGSLSEYMQYVLLAS